MFGFNRKIKKQQFLMNWQDKKIKLNVYHENRIDSRVSLTKTGVNIRLPILLPEFEKQKLIKNFIDWAQSKLDEKPHLYYDKFKRYQHGDIIKLFDNEYQIELEWTDSTKNELNRKENTLQFKISSLLSEEEQMKAISKLAYKFIAKKYKPIIWDWLQELNQQHQFGELKSTRMKNNSSNWGSCSNKGNINISVRLFLAPKDVVEYVLIHELAHLQEQNHGKNFWRIVEKACPDYKKHELWLKNNAKNCVI